MTSIPRIFCAIDTTDVGQAITIAKSIEGMAGVKLGLEFFNAHGVAGVRDVMGAVHDTPLFLDLKYHDIPNTVAGAIRAVTHNIKPAFLNVHASGGVEMMKAAKAVCPPETKLLAVTVLTSIDSTTLSEVGQGEDTREQVIRLSRLAEVAGLDGVVCSSHEIDAIRKSCGADFITMVPGIRPEGSNAGDQKRIMTPAEAVSKGANHLVIGRPITQSKNPAETLRDILNTI